jgi:hypothetical protein
MVSDLLLQPYFFCHNSDVTLRDRGRRQPDQSQTVDSRMVPNGPTKRKRGGIWARLGVSACVILLPPLVIAAGVMVFGSSPPPGAEPEGEAQEAAVSQTTVAKSASWAERPDGATGFGLASAEQHPVIIEQPPAVGQPAAAAGEQPTETKPADTKDESKPYYGPIPVTLIHVRKSAEPSEIAEIEDPPPPPPSTETVAPDAPVAVPKQSVAATRIHPTHAGHRMAQHEPHGVHLGKKPEHARPLNEPRRMASLAAPAGAGPGARGAQHGPGRKAHQK